MNQDYQDACHHQAQLEEEQRLLSIPINKLTKTQIWLRFEIAQKKLRDTLKINAGKEHDKQNSNGDIRVQQEIQGRRTNPIQSPF